MGTRGDATFCDLDARFTRGDMARVPELLTRGIFAGLVGDNLNLGDPTLLWTVDDNGWIFECRLTIPGRALYHGYPVLNSEAIARDVMARYTEWVTDRSPVLGSSVLRLRERYL
jgi:hypothetical protein